MLELTLIRHGQTACSVRDVYCGRCNVSLNDTGAKTAQALATHLADLNWTALYASPLARAQQTIAPLAQQAQMPVTTAEALTELHYGAWDGQSEATLRRDEKAAFGTWEKDPAQHAPPGGESAAQVAARLRPFVATLRERHPKGRVLCVSHKATLRILLGELLGIPLRDFRRRLAQPLGGITVVQFAPRGAHLRTVGDISYLPNASEGVAL